MERMLRDGDYVPDGAGGLETAEGAEEVLGRVLFRLTARRGAMPFLPGLGSRLHEVIREKPGARQTLCARYVAQALEKGAAAILCREPPRTGSWLSTPDPRAALARVSAAWFGYPGEEMTRRCEKGGRA